MSVYADKWLEFPHLSLRKFCTGQLITNITLNHNKLVYRYQSNNSLLFVLWCDYNKILCAWHFDCGADNAWRENAPSSWSSPSFSRNLPSCRNRMAQHAPFSELAYSAILAAMRNSIAIDVRAMRAFKTSVKVIWKHALSPSSFHRRD